MAIFTVSSFSLRPALPEPAEGMRVEFTGPATDALPTGTRGRITAVAPGSAIYWTADSGRKFLTFRESWGGALRPIGDDRGDVSVELGKSVGVRLCARNGCDKPAEDGSRFCCDSCFIKENW